MSNKRASRNIFLLLILLATTSLIALNTGSIITAGEPTDGDNLRFTEMEFDMSANPNPFDEFTIISVTLMESTQGSMIIKDRNNNIVNNLYSGTFKNGVNEVTWNGFNDFGLRLPPGRYLCELHLGDRYTSRTIILILK
jgi:hypothetical protein